LASSCNPPTSRTTTIPDNSESNVATADVLTLLLHNQHALAAAIEEVALWAKASGSSETHEHAIAAMETLDANASANHRWDSQAPAIIAIREVDLSGSAAAMRNKLSIEYFTKLYD